MALGIMQGRLTPPIEDKIQAFPGKQWPEEFVKASLLGLDCIEWIFEAETLDKNPIADFIKCQELKTLLSSSTVKVRSICADYFMEYPLMRTTQAELQNRGSKLRWLISRASEIGASRIILPLVDASKLESPQDHHDVGKSIFECLEILHQHKVELHLETSLCPQDFASFLREFPNELVKVNYDSGNSAALGYSIKEEFASYGERIGSVHIKDRVLGGGSVPLGQGNCDFDQLFEHLNKVNYVGDYILQVARGKVGEEQNWTEKNIAFVRRYI